MSKDKIDELQKSKQDNNTAKLIINTFYKIQSNDGVSPQEIAAHLQEQFGEVWNVSVLTGKAEEMLQRSAALGFLERHGDKYVASLLRDGCRRRQRRCRRTRRCRR